MSPFKNKIKMLVHNFKHKKQSTIENSYDPHNKFTKKTFEPKAVINNYFNFIIIFRKIFSFLI